MSPGEVWTMLQCVDLYMLLGQLTEEAQVAKQSIVASCLVDCGRLLVSIEIYLSPQYDQQLFV